jgi:hypothetical protein
MINGIFIQPLFIYRNENGLQHFYISAIDVDEFQPSILGHYMF